MGGTIFYRPRASGFGCHPGPNAARRGASHVRPFQPDTLGTGWGGRIEPTVHGTKNRCLTTWLRPTVRAYLAPVSGRCTGCAKNLRADFAARMAAGWSDILIIGGGAAGLFCAGSAQAQGARVGVLDESARLKDPHLGRRSLQLHQFGDDARAVPVANPRFCASPGRIPPAGLRGARGSGRHCLA